MAGDWITIQHALPDKPEVVRIAGMLGIDQDAVTGKLLRLWIWADQQSVDGCALSVTESFLDRHVFQTGFAEALRAVGWLTGDDGCLSFPNFDRHNGKTAKTRALAKNRMGALRSERNKKSTDAQPEKRREEKSIKKKAAPSKKFIPPTVAEVAAYCQERGNSVDAERFVDHYTANDWMRGKNKIKDWRAAVRTWENNGNDNRTGTSTTRRLSAAEQREAANADAFRAVFGDGSGDSDSMLDEVSGAIHDAPAGRLGRDAVDLSG